MIIRLKRILLLTTLFCLVFCGGFHVYASSKDAEIKKTNDKIGDLEDKKEQAEDQADDLAEQKESLQGDLYDLNKKLSDAADKLNELEIQITDKQAQIEVTGQELEAAKQRKDKQYADMKLRIGFMYKNGSADMVSVLLSSSSIADFLNKAEYIEAITQYDRDMLDQFELTCQTVAAEEARLEQEKTELLGIQGQMQQKKDEINTLIGDTQTNIANKQNQIAQTQEEIDEYESQIASMKAYEEKLEAQKAAADKKRMNEIKKQEKENNSSAPVTTGAGDAAMLAALVECEAGGESYEGQLAVASVVVNRVRSASFPNTVSGVIYQGGQFSPVASGRFALVLSRGASGSCAQAANAALSGGTNVSSLYFRNVSSGMAGTVIGNHVFY